MPLANPTPPEDLRFGAPLGRPTFTPPRSAPRLYLRRIRLDRGGYDPGGAYWGLGAPLYWYGDDSGAIDGCLRASSRDAAKAEIRANYPDACFFR